MAICYDYEGPVPANDGDDSWYDDQDARAANDERRNQAARECQRQEIDADRLDEFWGDER